MISRENANTMIGAAILKSGHPYIMGYATASPIMLICSKHANTFSVLKIEFKSKLHGLSLGFGFHMQIDYHALIN